MINCAHRRCMHGLIEIHIGFTTIGNIYNWGKFPEISERFRKFPEIPS